MQKVDKTRTALSEWLEIRRLISKEKRDWALGRDTLTQRIELVKGQIEDLKTKTAKKRKDIGDSDQKKVTLEADFKKITDTEAAFLQKLVPLENRVKELLGRLPEPILETVRPLSQQLPAKPEESKSPIGDRLRNVVGILNEVNRFNSEITVSTEVRTLKDGRNAEVNVLYIGIARAFYVTAKGDAAGIGSAGKDGWQWTPADDHAEKIALAIAIQKNEKAAEYVKLPIRIE